MRIDLQGEFLRAHAAFGAQLVASVKRLRALGIPTGRDGAPTDHIGRASVAQVAEGLYAPAVEESLRGRGALILPMFDVGGDLVDLLAVFTDSDMTLQRLEDGAALGFDYAEHQVERGLPLRLVRGPLDWLRRRGEAFCIFDWQDAAVEMLLRHAEEIEVDGDEELATFAYQHLHRPSRRRIPPVKLRRETSSISVQ